MYISYLCPCCQCSTSIFYTRIFFTRSFSFFYNKLHHPSSWSSSSSVKNLTFSSSLRFFIYIYKLYIFIHQRSECLIRTRKSDETARIRYPPFSRGRFGSNPLDSRSLWSLEESRAPSCRGPPDGVPRERGPLGPWPCFFAVPRSVGLVRCGI